LRDLQARKAGHLDVEEGDVGLQFGDVRRGLVAIACHLQHLQRGPEPGELLAQVGRQVRFVVGDQGGRHGVRLRARVNGHSRAAAAWPACRDWPP
jgi:hypothetical protein